MILDPDWKRSIVLLNTLVLLWLKIWLTSMNGLTEIFENWDWMIITTLLGKYNFIYPMNMVCIQCLSNQGPSRIPSLFSTIFVSSACSSIGSHANPSILRYKQGSSRIPCLYSTNLYILLVPFYLDVFQHWSPIESGNMLLGIVSQCCSNNIQIPYAAWTLER